MSHSTRCLWRFSLTPAARQTLALPLGAAIVSVQWHAGAGAICLWAWCDPGEPRTEPREFRTLMTGESVPDREEEAFGFLATVQMPDGIVAHVFEDFAAGEALQ